MALLEREHTNLEQESLSHIEKMGYQLGFSGTDISKSQFVTIDVGLGEMNPRYFIKGHSLMAEVFRKAYNQGKADAARVADDAQDEFDNYIESMAEEIKSPVAEAEDYLRNLGYDAYAMLADVHAHVYCIYIKEGKKVPKPIIKAHESELLARCQQWVKSEEMRKRDRALHLQRYGIAV